MKVLVLCSLLMLSQLLFAMNQQEALFITIVHSQLEKIFPVDATTTIEAIKQILFDQEGIPVKQQNLYAMHSKWWGFSQYIISKSLPNDQKIINVLEEYDTNTLALILSLERSLANQIPKQA